MGITGLLPLLKSIHRPVHVKDYKGKTLGVDSYVWLHRGAYTCAQELALGESPKKFVQYVMHRVRMLKHFGVTPYMVFDGAPLPSKRGTEEQRARKRAEALEKAKECLQQGNLKQARDFFVKSVDITPRMACQLIQALKAEGVQYIVAPYEADAQLAYLERKGIIDAIITEDSDLLVFGCKNVLFKLDSDGSCIEISRDRFGSCREYNLVGWSDVEFRQMAILSGCDYIPSIVGLGIKTAHRLMRQHRTAKRVIQSLRIEGQFLVPHDYDNEFRRAELTFLYQRVFNPLTKSLDRINPLEDDVIHSADQNSVETVLEFAGSDIDSEIACAIAYGEVDPETYQAFQLEEFTLPSSLPSRTPFSSKTNLNLKSVSKASGPDQKNLRTFFSPSLIGNPKVNTPPKSFYTPLQTPAPQLSNPEAESPLGVASRFFTTKSKQQKTNSATVTNNSRNYGMLSISDIEIDQNKENSDKEDEEEENIPTSDVCDVSPKLELRPKKRYRISQESTESSRADDEDTEDVQFETNANDSTPPTSDIDISSPCGNSSPPKLFEQSGKQNKRKAPNNNVEQPSPENLWSHVFVFDSDSPLNYHAADNKTPRATKSHNSSRTSSAPNTGQRSKSAALSRSLSARSYTKNNSFCVDDSEQSESMKAVTANWRARFSSNSKISRSITDQSSFQNNCTKMKTPVKSQLNRNSKSANDVSMIHKTPIQRLPSYTHQSIPSNKKTTPCEKLGSAEKRQPRRLSSSTSISSSFNGSPSISYAGDSLSLGALPSSTPREHKEDTDDQSATTPMLMTPTSALERFRFKRPVSIS